MSHAHDTLQIVRVAIIGNGCHPWRLGYGSLHIEYTQSSIELLSLWQVCQSCIAVLTVLLINLFIHIAERFSWESVSFSFRFFVCIVLCLVVHNCSTFCRISVLSCVTACWFCGSVLTATIINDHCYYIVFTSCLICTLPHWWIQKYFYRFKLSSFIKTYYPSYNNVYIVCEKMI